MKEKQKIINKKFTKGFTLLELLVVVLIIGVLAAIALPQYNMAVAKSKYNTIKTMTEDLVSSVERYYLATNTKPTNLEDLDIEIEGEYKNNSKLRKILPNGAECGFNYGTDDFQEIVCITKVNGKTMYYLSTFYYKISKQERLCYASTNITDITNKLCQIETGKNSPTSSCQSYYCPYEY